MTALLVVLLFVGFIAIDLVVRAVSKRIEAARLLREREAVLKTAVKLEFASEAKSLKRAEVPQARARILAVDDEAVVLDSFRKILVLAGFSVDTVETGQEALTLLRDQPYDFVFTDLKMPAMEGTEVVKAARHLRPDVDVAVITGFGSIETAVETMAFGAVDYVQKPFTEEELVAFANRLLLKRQARLEAQRRPSVRIAAPEVAETVADREYCVPGGAFVSPGHTWAQVEAAGQVCVGLDDFGRKAIRKVDRLELPATGTRVKRGEVLFVARRGDQQIRFRAPLSGEVANTNAALQRDPGLLLQSPYERGWVCVLRPADLGAELPGLRIGKPVVSWYQDEVMRLRREGPGADGNGPPWSELEEKFFGSGVAVQEALTETVGAS
jgi:CheY-like chemotaxis protein